MLHTRRWGRPREEAVVCIHGIAQHGGVFASLGEQLSSRGRFVVAVDLRGHGRSRREPPWHSESHVEDVLATVRELGVERMTLVGHSFGGLVAAALAASSPAVDALALLDPCIELQPERALTYAEIDRLDWSFATADGALTALLSSDRMVAAPRATVAAFAADDVRPGADGRFRFSYCPSAAVVMWSEATRAAPPVARRPTLLVRPASSFLDGLAHERRYRDALGADLTVEVVPNGHNVMWEAPAETAAAIYRFLER